MAYQGTSVEVTKSQADIRTILRRHGADRIAVAEQLTGPVKSVGVEFTHEGLLVRVHAPLSDLTDEAVAARARARKRSIAHAREHAAEDEERRIWRVLHWTIKARMEAIEEGLETFEQSFLPHLVDPRTNRTVWDVLHGEIDAGAMRFGGPGLKALGAGQ